MIFYLQNKGDYHEFANMNLFFLKFELIVLTGLLQIVIYLILLNFMPSRFFLLILMIVI